MKELIIFLILKCFYYFSINVNVIVNHTNNAHTCYACDYSKLHHNRISHKNLMMGPRLVLMLKGYLWCWIWMEGYHHEPALGWYMHKEKMRLLKQNLGTGRVSYHSLQGHSLSLSINTFLYTIYFCDFSSLNHLFTHIKFRIYSLTM